ncbi:MAG: RNA polymerase sigma factor [Bacteroidota bacterium]
MNPLTDNAIMLKVKNGDLDKLGLLFERHHRSLFGFLFHMTGQRELSEDLVQNVFYRILKYKHTFRGDGEFKTWMYHLARNVVNDNGRALKRTIKHQEVTNLAEEIGGGFAADESIHKKQELALLKNAMENLHPESREILILSKFQELKYHEIATIMDITEGAVKVRVHRALNQLKNVYLQIAN